MKNIIALFGIVILTTSAFGQQEIKKEVEVEEVNGVKKVTVTTESNGLKKVETFEGEEAEKLFNDKGEIVISEEIKQEGPRKEVRMTEENGVKKLVVKTIEGEVVTEEIYEGEAADAKLKEIESELGKEKKEPVKIEKKVMIKDKKSSMN